MDIYIYYILIFTHGYINTYIHTYLYIYIYIKIYISIYKIYKIYTKYIQNIYKIYTKYIYIYICIIYLNLFITILYFSTLNMLKKKKIS